MTELIKDRATQDINRASDIPEVKMQGKSPLHNLDNMIRKLGQEIIKEMHKTKISTR